MPPTLSGSRSFLVAMALCLAGCTGKAPPPTPLELLRAAFDDLSAANVRLNIAFTGVSALSDPAFTAGARAQGSVDSLLATFSANGDVSALVWFVMMDASEQAEEDLRETMDAMNDTNDEKHNKRDLLREMISLDNDLRDALVVAMEDAADTDAPSGSSEPTTLSVDANLLLGEARRLPVEAKGDVVASFDCPQFHFLGGQLDLIDLTSAAVIGTASSWPAEVRTTLDDWTQVAAVGRLVGGDTPADTLVACTVRVAYGGRRAPEKVDWTEARVASFADAATDATRAIRNARAEIANLTNTQVLAADEEIAFSAVVSGYETRLLAASAGADAKDLSLDVRDWLDSVSELNDLQTLRLQALLDDRQKFLNTLSNVMKDIATTQEALASNLK